MAKLGDSITTDHISPAGVFSADSDAGRYLLAKGVKKEDFNSYGSRRANHEVMVRGTFANVRLKNQLVPGSEGSKSKYMPDGSVDTIFETSQKYEEDMTPLIVLAGKGHEDYQEIKGKKYPMDERVIIEEILKEFGEKTLD